MIAMEIMDQGIGLALSLSIIALGALIQGCMGIGLGIVSVPVLALLAPQLLPGPILVATLLLTALAWHREWNAAIYRDLGWAFVGRLPGTFLGGLVVALGSAPLITALTGGMILTAVGLTALGRRFEPHPLSLLMGGFFSGFMGTTSAVGGPPIALVYQHADPARVRSSLAAYFTLGGVISLAVLAWFDRFGWRELGLGLLLAPPVLAGFFLSSRFVHGLPPHFRHALLILSALGGAFLTVKPLLS
ncbi:MAG: sulfite exporter TauE/SafE family protein [Magnetococcales bacterium]|nr:sulfite exporter TauE/SafE family protein [Magnetococcales bacterium]